MEHRTVEERAPVRGRRGPRRCTPAPRVPADGTVLRDGADVAAERELGRLVGERKL